MISFENTEVAFSSKNDRDLKQAYWLFKMVGSRGLVKFGKAMTNFALAIRLPIKWMIKPTIFKQFCGGETIDECDSTIAELGEYKIGTILDYSVEGKEAAEDFDATAQEIIATIHKGNKNDDIPFSVFKVTGISRFSLLEKVNRNADLTESEQSEWETVQARVDSICKAAHDAHTPVFIDAEETWIQDAVDQLADTMMERYNKVHISVYNTIQIYRWDRYAFLKKSHEKAKAQHYILGIKLVRGAYMEKERDRAQDRGYKSPIQPNKAASDRDYDLALSYCLENVTDIALVAGTHNENSALLLTELMEKHKVSPDNKMVYFAQLYGMSDHISYNLSNAGYNVAKYVPYGPVREVLPYLIRRADENTSVAGQTSRELSLIMKEKKRRKAAR
jgi:proline dehydrogenase